MRSGSFLYAAISIVLTACAAGPEVPAEMGPAIPLPITEAEAPVVTVDRSAESYPSLGSVEAAPALDLIQMDPNDPMSFFGSVTAVRTFPDGAFLVADARVGIIGIFERDGTLLRTLGGQGDGPGQFRTLSGVPHVTADSIWAWDEQASRMTIFPRDGGQPVVRTLFSGSSVRFRQTWVLPDRSVLAMARARSLMTGLAIDSSQARRDSVRFTLFDQTGRLRGPVLAVPGEEWLQLQYGQAGDYMMSVTALLPVGRDATFGVLSDGIVGGPNDRFEIRRWNLAGDLLRLSRFPALDRLLTDEDVADLKEAALETAEGVPERVEHVEMIYDPAFLPEYRPAFEKIVVDVEGRIWVRENDQWNGETTRWWLYADDSGELVGFLEVPTALEIHEFGANEIWGVVRDATNLPHVTRHAVELQLP